MIDKIDQGIGFMVCIDVSDCVTLSPENNEL